MQTSHIAAEAATAVDAAITAGKFPQARRDHYLCMYAADPAGTRALLARLAPVLTPVPGVDTTAGYTEADSLYAALYRAA